MPFYKLICSACGITFEQQATIAERTEKAIACPCCGSHEVYTDYAAGSAAVITAPSSAGCPGGCSCCACGKEH